jgi:prepilin-type N-terminal cleavage/methylation domain-containing protein
MTLSPSAMSAGRKFFLGFSLIEVLAAVAIIGIITFLAIPNIIRIRQESEQSLAESRVEALNLGMASLVQAQGPSAAADLWTGALTDQARYELIRPYLAFAPATLSTYLPAGYSASLPQNLLPLSPATLTLPSAVEEDPEEPEG